MLSAIHYFVGRNLGAMSEVGVMTGTGAVAIKRTWTGEYFFVHSLLTFDNLVSTLASIFVNGMVYLVKTVLSLFIVLCFVFKYFCYFLQEQQCTLINLYFSFFGNLHRNVKSRWPLTTSESLRQLANQRATSLNSLMPSIS